MGQSALTLAITGCGVLSSIGSTFPDFCTALYDQKSGRKSVAGMYEDPLPQPEACVISEFDVRKNLGAKGTSFFDRITGFVVTTSGMALADTDFQVTPDNCARVGMTLGSSTGSAKSTSDFSRETLVQDRPYLVNPVLFPNTVMNCAAGQAAIWYKLKGVNATVSGGQLSSLSALRYAAMAIRQGYADVLLVGGAQEYTPHVALGFEHAGVLKGTNTAVGEGCALFVVEDDETVRASGRVPRARVLACETGYFGGTGDATLISEGLARCITRALRRAGVQRKEVWGLSGSFIGNPGDDEVERAGFYQALGFVPPHTLAIKQLVGECFDAAGALQLAALLAMFQREPTKGSRIGLITSVGRDGSVGCAVIQEGQLWR